MTRVRSRKKLLTFDTMTVDQVLETLRLERETDLSLSAIGAEVGISDYTVKKVFEGAGIDAAARGRELAKVNVAKRAALNEIAVANGFDMAARARAIQQLKANTAKPDFNKIAYAGHDRAPARTTRKPPEAKPIRLTQADKTRADLTRAIRERAQERAGR